MKNPNRPKAKMNAAARVAAWRTSRNTGDNKGYRPNPRRTPCATAKALGDTRSDGSVWRQKPL